MMKTKNICVMLLLSGLFQSVLADDIDSDDKKERAEVRFSLFNKKTVEKAPYSAEAITELQHKLADGNQIATKTSTMIYRDSAGRTREDQRDKNGETATSVIYDPTAGTITFLDAKEKTARKSSIQFDVKINQRDASSKNTFEVVVNDQDKVQKNIIIRTVGRVDAESKNKSDMVIQNDLAMANFIRSADNKMGGTTSINNSFVSTFTDAKWAQKRMIKNLGGRDFEGVRAEGSLSSYEIPAGEIGNTQAIIVSDETWTSPELQITVYSKHSDPRSGDRIYRLANVKRQEIPTNQFVVPADYKVRDIVKEVKEKVEKIEKK
jgi:hypothetical protein